MTGNCLIYIVSKHVDVFLPCFQWGNCNSADYIFTGLATFLLRFEYLEIFTIFLLLKNSEPLSSGT